MQQFNLWSMIFRLLLAAALVLLAETVLDKVSARIRKNPEYRIEIRHQEKEALDNVLRLLKDHRMSIVNLKIRTVDQEEKGVYSAEVEVRESAKSTMILEKAEKIPGILSANAL